MVVVLSKIFDVRNSNKYIVLRNEECKTPFTFFVRIGNYVTFPYTSRRVHTCGFETRAKAEEFRNTFKLDLKDKVFVVLENNDFKASCGPMRLHKVFKNINDAHAYILSCKGIYGSEQGFTTAMGVNIYGDLYGYTSYNGYKLKIMEVL